MGIRKILIILTCLSSLSTCKGNVSAPIVNTIVLEKDELILSLNNIKPKNLSNLKCIRINNYCFDRYYSKNLIMYEFRNNNDGIGYYLLRTKGLPKTLFDHDGIYFLEIECVRINVIIELELNDGIFKVLSEEYNSYPEHHRWEHYKNTF